MDNWEAQVVFNPGKICADIYLHRKRDFGVREFVLEGGKIVKSFKTSEPKPNKLEFATLDDDQIRALMAAFDKYGIKRPEASYTQGKSEAMAEHLADMRKLVFEPGVIKVIQKGEVK